MHCLVLNNSRSVRSQQASTPQLLITPNQYYCFNTIFTRNVKKSRKVDMDFFAQNKFCYCQQHDAVLGRCLAGTKTGVHAP